MARSEAIRLTQAAFDAADMSAPLPGYRIENLAELTAQPPKPAKAAPSEPVPAPAPVQDVDATADKELEKIVDQERADPQRDDLLSAHANEE